MSTRAHRVHANIDRPDPALVARYRSVWVETVAAVCVRKPWLVDPAIKPLANREWRIC